jgi:peptidoglycan/LPS O-acetylase OafA/YrhL
MTTATPAAPSSTPRPGLAWSYRPELDGLRTFAVLTIVLFHAQVEGAANAFIVLDLFFVLSGFLVTNVVLQEVDVHGRLRVGRYYARRVRRLLPAAVVTILGTSVLFVLIASEPERIEFVRQAQAALVYLANWQFIADGTDYFAGDIRDSPFMHFWSLSVEEQYYIVFPLLVVAWWRVAPGRGRVLLGILAAGIVASLASQVYWGQVQPTRAYFATDARLFQLLAGAAMAVALREFATPAPAGGVSWPRLGRGLALAGMAGYVVFGTELVPMSTSHRNIIATLLAAALVLGVYTAAQSWLARGFALPWMTYLGKVSYGIYLWHWPAVVALERLFDVRPLVVAAMAIVLAVAMASMSYELLETPIRRGVWLDRWEWRNVGAGVALSVLAAAVVVEPILGSSRPPSLAVAGEGRPVLAGQVAEVSGPSAREKVRSKVPTQLDFERIGSDRGSAASCRPSEPDECVLVEGDGPHVVLVGDSHARMLARALAALAEEKGFRLSANVVSACPWQDGVMNKRSSRENQELCRESRRDFYRRTLPELDPDVVVLANFPRSADSWSKVITDYEKTPREHHRRFLRQATDRTMRLVDEAGAQAVIVKSVMGTNGWQTEGPDPLDCLARADTQEECLVTPPPDRPVIDSFYDRAAVDNDHVSTIDLNRVVCPEHPVCRPVVDGEVVWRNDDHVAASFFEAQREQVWRRLKDAGPAF